jgi:predicted RNA-binding protein with PUA-like domain
MAFWLVKSEPGTWSWDDHVRVGIQAWDGVRNAQAAANLKAMAVGDRAFFYHSVSEKRIVGVVEVTRTAYPDPTDPTGRWVVVDLRAVGPLPRPVGLAEIKADPALADLALVRQSRLSVSPIDAAAWVRIATLGGLAEA